MVYFNQEYQESTSYDNGIEPSHHLPSVKLMMSPWQCAIQVWIECQGQELEITFTTRGRCEMDHKHNTYFAHMCISSHATQTDLNWNEGKHFFFLLLKSQTIVTSCRWQRW